MFAGRTECDNIVRWRQVADGFARDSTRRVVASLTGDRDGVPVEYFTFLATPGTYIASG